MKNHKKELANKFIEIWNRPYTQDEYFRVILNIESCWDDYNEWYHGSHVCIKMLRIVPVEETGFWGNKRVVSKLTNCDVNIGVYAVKKPDGIYEMVTGMKLYPIPSENHLCCYGIDSIEGMSIVNLTNDLQLLNTDVRYKNQYINELNKATAKVWYDYFERKREEDEKIQASRIAAQQQAEAYQYLKSYNLPNNK